MKSFICIILCCFSIIFLLSSASPDRDVLMPISDDGWPGMENRQEKRGERHQVTPQDVEHFVWGSENGTFANMTLGTGEDELVISMERFAGKLKAAKCDENMTFTFKNISTFEHAKNDWEWVNFSENRTFILVDYPGCGDESSRDIWVVSNVHYDDQHFTVYLDATKKEWSDVARIFTIDFGKYSPSNSNVATRSIWGDIGDAVGGAAEAIGNAVTNVATKAEEVAKAIPTVAMNTINDLNPFNDGKQFNVNLEKTIPAQFLPSTLEDKLSFGIECVSCGTRGSLIIDGHVKVGLKGLEEFTISASTKSIAADLTLQLSAAGTLDRHGIGWKKEWDLIKYGPVPGLVIPKILTIGPNLQVIAGFSIDAISGSASITSGIVATIPDSKATFGFTLHDTTKFVGKLDDKNGWVPTFQKKPVEINAQISAEIDVYVQINIAFSLELDILKIGTQADIGLKIPQIKIMAEAIYEKGQNATPVCPNSLKTSGISIKTTGGAELRFQAYEEVGGIKNRKYFIDEALFSRQDLFKFPNFCKGFGPDKQPDPEIADDPSGSSGAAGEEMEPEPSTFVTSTTKGTFLPSVASETAADQLTTTETGAADQPTATETGAADGGSEAEEDY